MENFQEFPTGKKFYPVKNEQQVKTIREMLNTNFIEACKTITEAKINRSDYFNPNVRNISTVKLLSNEEFPKIEPCSSTFLALNWTFSTTINHKACFYQTPIRMCGLADMPYFEGMVIQWDDTRKGIIVHNHPYEGELIATKESAAVKRKLKEHLNTLLGEAGMFTLLGKDMKTPRGYMWQRSDKKAATLEETITKTFSDKPKYEDVLEVALTTGVYTTRYNRADYSYYLERTTKKPKLYTSVRTKMLYKMGGLTLPDNYKDWFDG
jgi:hypothetical protein